MTAGRSIAISGLGSVGRQHLAAALRVPDAEVVVYDHVPALREAAQRTAPNRVRGVGDFDALLARAPTALIVATPDAVHLEQLTRAADAGVPVLVEKPLAPDAASVAAVLPQILTTGTPVLVGYVLRYRPVLRRLRELLASGAVGTPTGFQVMLGAYETLIVAQSRFDTAESNRLYRDYSHEWDYLRWFFGPLRWVFAFARTEPVVEKVEQPNLVDGLLRADGVVGGFHIDYTESGGGRTLTVIGTEGRLVADFSDSGTITRPSHGMDTIERHPMTRADGLAAQLEHLLQVAGGHAEPLVGLDDGFAAVAVADAAIASAATGTWAAVGEFPVTRPGR